MKVKIDNVNIVGIATCVPERVVDIFDNKLIYNGDISKLKRIVDSTGFHKRHILQINSTTTAGDMCYEAAEKLIDATNTNKNDIGAIIMLTQYPDYFEPATACVLHGKLNLDQQCIAFDINQGCAGYIYGLLVASKLVSKDKKILLLCGDTGSRALGTQEDIIDDMPIFGDGVCATILEYSENANTIYFNLENDGKKSDVLCFKNGGFRNPPNKTMFKSDGSFDYGNYMDGLAVFEFTMNTVPQSINNILDFANKQDADIDYYILHQANKMILETIAVSAKISANKVLRNTLSRYGNLSSASVASVLCDEYEKFNQKECRIVLNAFGVGLSWGSALLELKNTLCLPIIFYEE